MLLTRFSKTKRVMHNDCKRKLRRRSKDRVAAMNKALESGMVMVNEQACPDTARCLEQQAYDKNGEPDKGGGSDHQNDATSYPIAYEMPVVKPVINIPVRFAL